METQGQDKKSETASPGESGSASVPSAGAPRLKTNRVFAVRQRGCTLEIPVLFENNRIEFAAGNSEAFDQTKYEIFPAWHWQVDEFHKMRAEGARGSK